ncbi:cytochrome P450 [Nocardia macrotermitis]|uniref:Biotin biosynthesis cytochrome P450 n=1 Tax=Nocardia macrotermitis TaxID=2585198 RepID=A0A7K0CUG5_9NOCA|nr:cytochrome P450 [Nocardia macrotermitis]MQY17127.1 Biotin biosynthesis cytochrome P450 [Nocardia macrotermitis]
MTVAPGRIRFNPFGAEFRRDPYPMYSQLREAHPVHRTLGMWVLTRYEDVRAVLHDRSFSASLIPRLVDEQAARLGQNGVDRIGRLGRKSLVFTDNPDHARLRGLVNRVFTAPAVAELRPLVSAVTARLMAPAWDAGQLDVIADLAAPLPITVLCEWMALPPELRAQVGPWTHDIRFLLEPGMMKAADFARVREVVELFAAALSEVIDERRRRPGDDLISRLLAAHTAGGDRLTDEELIFVCMMCFVAGNETTKSLIGNGVLALLRHPAQDALLRERPERVDAAVTEALRYDCPLQLTKRLATRDVQIGGQLLHAGDQVLVCLGAANRDPESFERPDEFDLTRDASGHLAFGHGMHGCLGGLLAELQARAVFEFLYRHSSSMTLLDSELSWQEHSFIVRGLTGLPVAVRRAA